MSSTLQLAGPFGGARVFLYNVQPKKSGMNYILAHQLHEMARYPNQPDIYLLHSSNLHLRPGTTGSIIAFPHLPLLLLYLLINLCIKFSAPVLDLTTANHALEEGYSDKRDAYPCEENAKV